MNLTAETDAEEWVLGITLKSNKKQNWRKEKWIIQKTANYNQNRYLGSPAKPQIPRRPVRSTGTLD